ncbi:hypothetical protein QR685DRAFT_431986 [Neurospora intermedia]|uniref:Uncharacterized protein n=1 Tax=Neurospora intermedia TaxID=5142 RepID=A0ABR3DQH9_NEUIN
MPGDNKDDLERGGREAQLKTKPTRSPLSFLEGSVESLTRRLSRSSKESKPVAETPDKKYVHTPTHAAASHLKTTRTRNMDRANEASSMEHDVDEASYTLKHETPPRVWFHTTILVQNAILRRNWASAE